MGASQGITHSVFPVAQPGTYASYNYNPNAAESTSSGLPSWIWILLCLIVLGLITGGLWYYFKNRQTPVVIPEVVMPGVPTPVVTTTTETVTNQNSVVPPVVPGITPVVPTTPVTTTTREVEAVDEDHHSHAYVKGHLRYWMS